MSTFFNWIDLATHEHIMIHSQITQPKGNHAVQFSLAFNWFFSTSSYHPVLCQEAINCYLPYPLQLVRPRYIHWDSYYKIKYKNTNLSDTIKCLGSSLKHLLKNQVTNIFKIQLFAQVKMLYHKQLLGTYNECTYSLSMAVIQYSQQLKIARCLSKRSYLKTCLYRLLKIVLFDKFWT